MRFKTRIVTLCNMLSIRALILTSLALTAAGIRCFECVYTRDLGEFKDVFGKSDDKCQNPVRRHSVEKGGDESKASNTTRSSRSARSAETANTTTVATTTTIKPGETETTKAGPAMKGKSGSGSVPTCVKMEALVVRQLGHLKAALGPVIIRTVRMYPEDQPLICENTDSPMASNWSTDPLVGKIYFAKSRLCLCRDRIPPNWKPECNGVFPNNSCFGWLTFLAFLLRLSLF